MNYIVLFFVVISTLLFAGSAHALRVGNCDSQSHTVALDYYGEVQEITLEPNQHRRLYGRARTLALGEQTITLIRHNNEYCIYDGVIKLQRRSRSTRGFW